MWQVGCPVATINKWMVKVGQLGHTVGRVEQVVDAAGQVVGRAVKQIMSPATIHLMPDWVPTPAARHILALAECQDGELGVCFMDVSMGQVYLGELEDDGIRSKLALLLCHVDPCELVHGRTPPHHVLSEATQNAIVRHCRTHALGGPLVRPVQRGSPREPLWRTAKTLAALQGMLSRAGSPGAPAALPESLRQLEHKTATLAALGVLLRHLEWLGVGKEVLAHSTFQEYVASSESDTSKHLELDPACIASLNLLEDQSGCSEGGGLLAHLDATLTSPGRRRLRTWLLRPLRCTLAIAERQEVLEALFCSPPLLSCMRKGLKMVHGDVERELSKLFSLISSSEHQTGSGTDPAGDVLHPGQPEGPPLPSGCHEPEDDNVSATRGDAKIADSGDRQRLPICKQLLVVLALLRGSCKTVLVLKDEVDRDGNALCRGVACAEMAAQTLVHFENKLQMVASDDKAAEEQVVPVEGADHTCDTAARAFDEGRLALRQTFDLERRRINGLTAQVSAGAGNGSGLITSVRLWQGGEGGDDDNLLEVLPANARVPEEYEEAAAEEARRAEAALEAAVTEFIELTLREFVECRPLWQAVVDVLAELDVVQSLATRTVPAPSPPRSGGSHGQAAPQPRLNWCRPLVVPAADADPLQRDGGDAFHNPGAPMLEMCDAWHPLSVPASMPSAAGGSHSAPWQQVPCSMCLGGAGGSHVMLLTGPNMGGPNMGGKSTALRLAGLVVVLAQMGCRVPASSCMLTPVDRLFTRLGASDNIMEGRSTFLEEMLETSALLRWSSRHSLALLDELGRGTSTHDGLAIAHAVLCHLAENVQCRVLFATHYFDLTRNFDRHQVQIRHMACRVEEQHVQFLYELRRGEAPHGSCGIAVAAMAGIPLPVIFAAARAAAHFRGTDAGNEEAAETSCLDRVQMQAFAELYWDPVVCCHGMGDDRWAAEFFELWSRCQQIKNFQ
ncbi:hypothetical protein CYMTET_6911 [Cymbomonas tetramitiformis]|uniref:DNA mismatch repair proteins mutS family domain-containing protein n=1 Tax=Cymbomonas tetramitiformis TaxID=36881 RepID=A0AAE0GWP1_9CHLO|nr:hypothetical protein CYMTET_6911 [Cymbomonas tetramitiformis]KAK3285491.1 hypothetical protein CYMTET_6911 [Cymbomonas tetramitiformis]